MAFPSERCGRANFELSVEAGTQHDETEAQVSAASLLFALQKAPYAQLESLFSQHILVRRKLTSIERSLAPTI